MNVFAEMLILEKDIYAKAAAALGRFEANPTDPQLNSQREVWTYFELFCHQLQQSGHAMLASFDEHRNSLKSAKRTIALVTAGLQKRESDAQQKAFSHFLAPSVELSAARQPRTEKTLAYESLYIAFPPGTPIRKHCMPCARDKLQPADLVRKLASGQSRSLYYEQPDDFMDANATARCIDPFICDPPAQETEEVSPTKRGKAKSSPPDRKLEPTVSTTALLKRTATVFGRKAAPPLLPDPSAPQHQVVEAGGLAFDGDDWSIQKS
jgi:hypothetical protein